MTETKKLSCANGALLEVPVYEQHERGTNWLALIAIDPTKPGGLSRAWVERGKGECFYLTEKVGLFDALEFGADYTTSVGRKHHKRWYGVVVSKTERAIEVEECASGKEACLLSAKKRETPADLSKALRVQRAALLARISELDREIIEVEAAPAEDFDSFAARLIASIK